MLKARRHSRTQNQRPRRHLRQKSQRSVSKTNPFSGRELGPEHQEQRPTLEDLLRINELFRYFGSPFEKHYEDRRLEEFLSANDLQLGQVENEATTNPLKAEDFYNRWWQFVERAVIKENNGKGGIENTIVRVERANDPADPPHRRERRVVGVQGQTHACLLRNGNHTLEEPRERFPQALSVDPQVG